MSVPQMNGYHVLALEESHLHRLKLAGDPGEREVLTLEAAEKRNLQVSGRVAVLTIDDVITDRAGYWAGIPAFEFGLLFDRLVGDSGVGAIVLDIASPGGTIFGTPELAARIRAARGTKPIVAVANAYAFSAAYWVASAADEIVVTPSGMVGSVGVITTHVDYTGALEQNGVKVTNIRSTPFKQEANPYEPLTDEARAELQRLVDSAHDDFVTALAKNRGVTKDDVRANFGKGRMVEAKAAIERGMADRIDTLDAVVGRMVKASRRSPNRARAMQRRLQALTKRHGIEISEK